LGQVLEAEEFYEQAIKGARENEFLQEEALAYELAAKFYLARGREKFAQTYIKEAHYCYLRWGAIAKVKDLEAKYPQLLTQSPTATHTTKNTRTINPTTTTSNSSGEALDLSTVMKASQAIASEIVLDKLLASLMKILIENAGAQTGILILDKAGEWVIEARGEVEFSASSNVHTTTVLQSISLDNHLPVSIINYVARTLESVVLNDANHENKFTDEPYIKEHQNKSILCAPLLNQGKLVGMVYLENNLSTGAFTQERLEVLNLLSSQAAISIKNAKLYLEIKESERALRENKSRLDQFLEAVPVGIAVLDASGKLYYANQRAIQLLGKRFIPQVSSEQIPEIYQLYIAGTDKKYPTEELAIVRALRGERTTTDNLEIRQSEKVIPVETWGSPIFDENGNVTYALVAFQDITKRKQADKILADYNQTLKRQVKERTLELEREKELLKTIFDHIPVMIALYDANGRIQLVNRELERVLGWKSEELEAIDLFVECYPEPQYRALVLEHMIAATGKWQDFKTKTRSGSYVDTSWANIRLSHGMNIGIGQDITERLAAVLRERQQAEDTLILEERNRIAREIHDTLAQVLTGVFVHMETAKVVVPPDSKARTHINHAQELARDGLAEARRSVWALRPQVLEQGGNLGKALEDLVNGLTAGTPVQALCTLEEIRYPLPLEVENNLLRIAQESLNNTLKHAHASTIHVELTFANDAISLRIWDNGRGFNPELHKKGFGLVGMHERIRGLGGQLKIKSQPGQGTEVLAVVSLALSVPPSSTIE
jgi:PAS domain S-box-containing protein